MGAEAKCRAVIDGLASEGKALLETNVLLFRGSDIRVQIPFAEIRKISADDGALRIDWKGGKAELELGKVSAKWLDKIQNPPSLMKKLGVKAGMRVAIRGLDEFRVELESAGAQVVTREPELTFLGAESERELAQIGKAAPVWVVYPKGRKDITQNQVLQAGRNAGLVDVKVASFSGTHTALKFTAPKT